MGDAVVEALGVTRHFGSRIALDDVSLTVKPQTIVALLGPNGSGKTTLLKIMAGLIKPTAGSVRVFGLDSYRSRPAIMARARFAFAPPSWYPNLTARETLTALSNIGLGSAQRVRPAQVHQALDLVGLSDRADDRVRVFSFGMRQRLALAQALLPRPELLVLDEPADGLDPLAILELRDILRRLRTEHGMTIILSSHMLLEVERLVDDVMLLHDGGCLLSGAPSELNGAARSLRLVVSGGESETVRLKEALVERGIRPLAVIGTLIELSVGALTMQEADQLATDHGLTLTSFAQHKLTLEEVVIERLRKARNQNAPTTGSASHAARHNTGGTASC